mgnify:CR=1 FL=1
MHKPRAPEFLALVGHIRLSCQTERIGVQQESGHTGVATPAHGILWNIFRRGKGAGIHGTAFRLSQTKDGYSGQLQLLTDAGNCCHIGLQAMHELRILQLDNEPHRTDIDA